MSAYRQPVKLEIFYHRLVYSVNINRCSINQWFLPQRVYKSMQPKLLHSCGIHDKNTSPQNRVIKLLIAGNQTVDNFIPSFLAFSQSMH